MTDAKGLYPFISKIRIIKQTPDIEDDILSSLNFCEPIIMDDLSIYTVITQEFPAGKKLSLIKLVRQDFHDHYYSVQTVLDGNGTPIEFAYYTYFFSVKLYYDKVNKFMYLFFTCENQFQRWNLYKYEIATNMNFEFKRFQETVFTQSDINQYQFENIFNDDFFGLGQFDGEVLTINYYYNAPLFTQDKTLTINIYLDCTISLTLTTSYIYIIVREADGKISVAGCVKDPAVANLTFNTPQLSSIVVNQQQGVTLPCMPKMVSFSNDHSLIYGFNNDSNNIFQLTFIDNDTTLLPAYYYKINKFEMFNEVLDSEQTNMAVSVTSHPDNENFFYVAYITGTNQIRLMKFFKKTILNKSLPILMWATRLGVFENFDGQMSITIDKDGHVYVISRSDADNVLSIYKTNEFILDLGHAETNIVAPIDTIPNLLTSIDTDYTITTQQNGIYIPGQPEIKNVVIDSIIDDGKLIKITFKYINYDILQVNEPILVALKTAIIDAFRTLHEDSTITVLNLNFTDVSIDGDNDRIIAFFKTGTKKNPCVLKGTQIVIFKNGEARLINVEKIQPGDSIINHEGKKVKVLNHMISTIYTQDHNAPYFIPKHFFGENRPYTDLYISGDHAILLTYKNNVKKVIYAQDIKILKQCFKNKIVEYHHLLLEDHQDNFYLANGLEVDSYHPNVVMKRA